ncbi:MAG: CPBP family intramembrane metalloprotease [Anaerolineae bacterium]|nr:CPBP family intramembrane metalloprotease [Anaerolineae bacterium]NIQ82758.1 CPBP family intramembrane metalloprotease [Anaerolineae bacterium]
MRRPNSNLKAAIILVSSTLLLIISHYHTLLGDDTVSSFILYFLIPLGIIVLVFREDPRKYGLRLGDWKKGAMFSVGGIALMAVVIVGLVQLDEFRQYYRLGRFEQPDPATLAEFALRLGIFMFSWEFMFRGFMLFGLKERFGSLAIWIQAIPFAIMHVGKPELETLSTIFGGAAFGYVDLESRSVFPSVVIHWAIYMMMVLAATWF